MPLLAAFIFPFFFSLLGFIPQTAKALGDFRTYAYFTFTVVLTTIIRKKSESLFAEIKVSPRQFAYFFAAVLATYIAGSFSAYFAFDINGYDYSIFDWMMYNFTHSGIFYSPIYRVNHLGIHPSWYLVFIAPFHFLANSNLFLLFVGAALLASALIPLYFLCLKHKLPPPATLFVLFAYSAAALTQFSVKEGFRIESAIPVLFFVFLLSEKWFPALLFLAVKEDIALYLGCYSLFEFLISKKNSYLLLFALCLAVFFANTFVAQPYFLEGVKRTPEYLRFWANYGTKLPEIALTMLTSPIQIASDILKSGWWRVYAPLLFLPFLSRRAMTLSLPAIFILGTASANPTVHQYGLYYPLFLWSAAIFGCIEAFHKVPKKVWYSALLLPCIVHAGSLKIRQPDFALYSDLQAMKAFIEKEHAEQTLCTQTAAFPYLGYNLNLEPLDENCLAKPNRLLLVIAGKNPYPDSSAHIDALIQKHTPVVKFGPVLLLE